MRRHAWMIGPGLVAFIMLTSLTGASLLVYYAHSDPSFAVEANYYDRAVHWDEAAAQERMNAEMGWVVELAVPAGVGAEPGQLCLALTDQEGDAIEGAQVRVEAFHNARASDRTALALEPAERGRYSSPIEIGRAGLWEFRVTASRGDEVFTAVVQRMIPEPAIERGARP